MAYELNQFYYNGKENKKWLQSMKDEDIRTTIVFRDKGINTEGIKEPLSFTNSFKDVAFYREPSLNNDVGSINFSINTTYYVRCMIERDDQIKDIITDSITPSPKAQEIYIKLVALEGNYNEKVVIEEEEYAPQYIKTIDVGNITPDYKGSRWQYVDFTFTPKNGNFNAVLFQLSRESADYYIERIPRVVLLEMSKSIDIISSMGSLMSNGKPLLKIGVQSAPGARMIINNEEIYIGRTGVYELKNKNIKIENFSLINPGNDYENLELIIDNLNTTKDRDKLSTDPPDNSYFKIQDNLKKTIGINNTEPEPNVVNFYKLYKEVSTDRKFNSFTLDYIYNKD